MRTVRLRTSARRTNVVAFENTQGGSLNNFYASLNLYDGSTLVATLSTKGLQGWVANGMTLPPNLGGNIGTNTSYTAGSFNGNLLADYFGFNMGAVSASLIVTSAQLVVYQGTITNNLKLQLFAASDLYSELTNPMQQGSQYSALISGTSYGMFSLAKTLVTSNPMTQLVFTLNAAAVTDVQKQIVARQEFVIAGDVTSVPEPSTWIMMLAGFAGLGLLARRRAARRRAEAMMG